VHINTSVVPQFDKSKAGSGDSLPLKEKKKKIKSVRCKERKTSQLYDSFMKTSRNVFNQSFVGQITTKTSLVRNSRTFGKQEERRHNAHVRYSNHGNFKAGDKSQSIVNISTESS